MTPAAVESVRKLFQRNGKRLVDLAIDIARSKSTNGVPPKEGSLEAINLMAKEAIGKPFTLSYKVSGKSKTRSGIFQGIYYDKSSKRFMICFHVVRNDKVQPLKIAAHDLVGNMEADVCT